MRRLEARILHMIQNNPKIHKCAICRIINERPLHYCGNKTCYANPRKRGSRKILPHFCRVPLSTIRGNLRRLVDRGLVIIKREKKKDGDNLRGWDWFKCCYSTGRYWFA